MTGNNHAGLKIINQDREHFKYPICDNCHKEITTIGRYTWHDGHTIYVHIKYNEKTHHCNLTGDY